MDNLDLLIEKFKEAKYELQKTESTKEVEDLDKALPPGAKVHMLHDASRAAAAAAPKVAAVKPGEVADRGPVQAKKDLNWLTGPSTHGSAPDVPAGHGRDIPGFEKEEISFSKSGQWSLGKAVNTIGASGTNDDSI